MDKKETPYTDRDDRPYPSPEYAQRIRFEGAECAVIAPEEYEALYEQCRELERERNRLLTASYRAVAKLICADETLRTHGLTNLGNEAGDELVANVAMLLDKQKTYLNDIKNLEEELEQCREVISNTRITSTSAMNEIRAAAGAPQSQDDKSQKRAVDYVKELRIERDHYREALESISAETDMRNCRGIADRALKIP